jgi:hypothetical protein
MRWYIKAFIQNIISILPHSLSIKIYYIIQKKFGRLKTVDYLAVTRLIAGLSIWEKIIKLNHNPSDKIFYELGSGKVPILPIALWLMGAKKIISIDKDLYFSKDLFFRFINYLKNNKENLSYILNNKLIDERLEKLLKYPFEKNNDIRNTLKESFNIEFLSIENQNQQKINPKSVDFYISYSVLEHVNKQIINKILIESKNILKKTGLQIHFIDYSDHYAQTDKKISRLNFLKFSDWFWNIFYSNYFMYVNRLRHDDFIEIFNMNKLNVLDEEIFRDSSFAKFKKKYKINYKFINKKESILNIMGAWIILQQ